VNSPHIILRDLDLYYAATAYKERSLKSALGKWIYPRSRDEAIDDIHALKDVSVTITSGERVALIGRNGAGKSTLLRTIAGLYPIASGTMDVKGEVRSLFDLSLGFEPDATGRENIMYRGLLLGLTPAFMRAKESEIVDFADLGKFIDYPIKTYSAGMQVRLAFAISTAVGGDILLLDEVIGAGDANFMAKARTRIENLVQSAEIVLLASHDASSLRLFCNRALLLHHGRIIYDGQIDNALEAYHNLRQ